MRERDRENKKKRGQFKGHMQLRRQLTMSREEAEVRAAEEQRTWRQEDEPRKGGRKI